VVAVARNWCQNRWFGHGTIEKQHIETATAVVDRRRDRVAGFIMAALTFEDSSPADLDAPRDLMAIALATAGCTAAFVGAAQLTTRGLHDVAAIAPMVGGLALRDSVKEDLSRARAASMASLSWRATPRLSARAGTDNTTAPHIASMPAITPRPRMIPL